MNRKAFFIILVAMISLVIVATASASGATQISGTAFIPNPGECNDLSQKGPEGQDWDFSNRMEGDALEGCLYVFVMDYGCSHGGTYWETGTELYVDEDGTFRTTYRFTAKFEECPFGGQQFFGRCQHPIMASTGTGKYEGVTGRIDFKDDLDAGNFPYTGHLRW